MVLRSGDASEVPVARRVEVMADMVASVVGTVAGVGDEVAEGDALLLMESMKMEIPVLAPATGVLTALHAEPGEVVEEGDLLAVIDAE